MGQMNYEDSRRIWVAEGFYPSAMTSTSESSSAVSSTIEINRGDDWYCSMHKKDKRTGVRSIPSEKTKSVATKYLEFKDKEIQGTFKPNKNKDALYMAFGEKLDRPGRAFGYGGVNIGIRKAFGYNPKIVSESGLHGRNTTFEDQEA
ncbi:unnamed protein product [Amaranthus hypochondriacus]